MFENLFLEYLDLRGRKYYNDEGKCMRSSIILKLTNYYGGD
jgi:hypothetical protein